MIIISDRTLRDAGLDFDTARAMLSPPAEELVVHVKLVLDEPPQPQATERLHAESVPRLSHADTKDGGFTEVEGVDGATDFESAPTIAGAALPSGWTVKATGAGFEMRHPATGTLVTVPDRDAVESVMQTFDPTAGAMPPRIPRLPERGCTLGQVREVAHALRAEAQVEPDGTVQLVSAFGTGVYGNLAQAAQALNRRSFTLGDPDQ